MLTIKSKIQEDLKQAMLAGDRLKSDTLKMIKSAILNEEIASGNRDGLPEDTIIILLKKESKKRQEAADLYKKAGSPERAQKEEQEKIIIDDYLPDTLDDNAINSLIDQVEATRGKIEPQKMGLFIGEIKKLSNNSADGSDIARLVKARIAK
jgi:uncharacterized protein YqeY